MDEVTEPEEAAAAAQARSYVEITQMKIVGAGDHWHDYKVVVHHEMGAEEEFKCSGALDCRLYVNELT